MLQRRDELRPPPLRSFFHSMSTEETLTLDPSFNTSQPIVLPQQMPSPIPALQQQQQQQQQFSAEYKPPQQPITLNFLKDGRLFYKEPKLLAENHRFVHQRIAAFRDQRQQIEATLATSASNHIEFPADYNDLIVALSQDSDETLSQMTQRINDLLSPYNRNEQFVELFSDAIERSIKACANRTKYGLLPRVLTHLEGGPTVIPNHLCLYRWEANVVTCLPEDLQNYIHQRRDARVQVLLNSFQCCIQKATKKEGGRKTDARRRKAKTRGG
ncbi:hypothetical protein BX666DRAFT_840484 [Dichotomocladium elegans]|nr:hypothetical protein BX666DRAFT_840484 [Dichotomocladium elegans]